MWPTSCQRRITWGKKSIALAWISHTFIHLFIKNKLNSAKKRETEVQNTILFLFPFVPSGYKRKVDQKKFFLLLRFCGNRNIFSPSFPPTWVKMIFLGSSQITSGKKMLKMLTHIFFRARHFISRTETSEKYIANLTWLTGTKNQKSPAAAAVAKKWLSGNN